MNYSGWLLRQIGTGAGTNLELYNGASSHNNFLITSQGWVGIGVLAPTAKLEVAGDILANDFHQSSSIRWKKDIGQITDPLGKLMQIQGVSFDWIFDNRSDIGFIAEDIGGILPEIVDYEANGIDARSLNYSKVTSLLVEAIKDLNGQIGNLGRGTTGSE